MTNSEPDAIPFDRSFSQKAGEIVQLSPLVRRIVCDNGGPFTFTGTCTYLIGELDVIVLDPGPVNRPHIEAILAATSDAKIAAILVTHTHMDHSPAAAHLKALTGAPIYGCAPHFPARPLNLGEINPLDASADKSYAPDHILNNGESVDISGYSFDVIHTPGHTANHLCYAFLAENALFSGDHVMAWSTSIVAPPDGAMGDYMASLEKLRGRGETIFWPGHGGPVNEPQRFIRALLHHRRHRESSILTRLRAGDRTAREIVEQIYEKLDPRLKGAAALSVFAHLEELVRQGQVICDGEASLISTYRPR